MRPMILAPILLSLCGCWFSSGYGDSELTRTAVIRIAGEYIGHVLTKNQNQLDGLVLWSDYTKNKDQKVTRTTYFKQLASIPPLPADETNPLVGLDVYELDIDGDDARITFVKHGLENPPKIEVQITWVGQGWLVVDDTLFGPDEYLEKLGAAQQSS